MKKISVDTWIQLIGMLSVLAGLVFVGLEMQQNQRIALAAQQTARVEIFSEIVNSLTESGVQYYAGLSPVEEFDPQLNVTHQLLWIFLVPIQLIHKWRKFRSQSKCCYQMNSSMNMYK